MNNHPTSIRLQYSVTTDNDHYNQNQSFGRYWVDEYDNECGYEAMDQDLMVNSHGDMLNRLHSLAHRTGPIKRKKTTRRMRKLLSFFEMAHDAQEIKNG